MSKGKWSETTRAKHAEAAAKAASQAAQEIAVKPELPLEPKQSLEEKNDIVRRPPRNEPRRLAMEEIEARDMKSKGIEPEAKEPEAKTEPVPEPAPPSAEDMLKGGKFSQPEIKEEPKVEAPKEEPKPETKPEIKTIRVKVDGEEFDAPAEEVEAAGGIKAFQMMKASENRLKKSNETLAETRKMQAMMTELVKQAKPPEPSVDQLLQSKIDVIRWGTPEESSAAMKEVISKMVPQIDQNKIIEMATDRIRHDTAVKEFDKEFEDIGASPLHIKLALALRAERLQKGHPGDWSTFYRSIGNEVRSVMPRPSQSPTTETKTTDSTSPASDKEARKASIVNLPTGAARAELPKESKPETREDVLAQMRKSRGLPVG
jgi:hypothetical protein